MNQAISGVTPPSRREVTNMVVWPSIAATKIGRLLGCIYQWSAGFTILGIPVTIGRLLALPTIPVGLAVYAFMKVPILPAIWFKRKFPWLLLYLPNKTCRRYRLTNRRVIIEQGLLGGAEQRSVSLDRFNTIEIVDPEKGGMLEGGQDWFPAGELVFRLNGIETFRLPGVKRPETFRQTCLKAQIAYVGVQKAQPIAVGA